jgi:hypothetical protein
MQRKNSILNRSGMAMIMAIFVIVIISTILALSLRLSTQTTQKTTDLYLYEQSAILAHSAAEYGMLELAKVAPCSLANRTFTYNGIYDINITMRYIPAAGTACAANASTILGTTSNYTAPNGISLDGNVIMDITVTANPTGTTEPVRYFRRTVQKL